VDTTRFVERLTNAQGRSQFVIVVVADIRGFSVFSKQHEAPDVAMYIKRFYCNAITSYFKNASFVKSTGDGLLMTFEYTEKNLFDVSKKVLESCLKCLEAFPNICKNEPMINFAVPRRIGFGITRGTACCLFSGDDVIDYSGHQLNLASRLMDYARPQGIVIAESFSQEAIPGDLRSSFMRKQVYVRSIAERSPMEVFYLKGKTEIPEYALSPMGENWVKESYYFNFYANQGVRGICGGFGCKNQF